MELKDINMEIEKTDDEIAKLFLHRLDLISKAQADCENFEIGRDREGERELLNRVSAQGGAVESYIRLLFVTLLDVSRSYQNRLRQGESQLGESIEAAVKKAPAVFPQKGTVACQGIEGAYSQIAGDKLFPMANIMYLKNFESVFNAVEKGLCEFGILPIENSSNGSVNEVYDLMKHYRFHIVRSIKVCIQHELLAKPGTKMADIKEIVSHDQALGQCSSFLKEFDVKITTFENTAAAAKYVANADSNQVAAISSHNCAELYGLTCINDNIQNSDNNYTRFICISKNMVIYPGADRISLMLSVSHEPGALYRMNAKFAALGLNLTKLESRPIVGKDFEFMFYFDIQASVQSPQVISLLSELAETDETFVFLGNYSEV